MKKYLSFLALALCVGFLTLSCSSDDDNNNNNDDDGTPTGYSKEKYAEQSAAYTIAPGTVKSSQNSKISIVGLHITESGLAEFEIDVEGKKKFVSLNAEINGNEYILKDGSKIVGSIKKNATRATVLLDITVTMFIPEKGECTFTTTDPVQAEEIAKLLKSSDLIATWSIERMKVTLDFDEKTDASTEVYSGNLEEFLKLAKQNNIKLKEDEEAALKKEILTFTVDGYGLFTIKYKDGSEDAAKWEWDGDVNKLRIELKDEDMGNKFLNSSSKIEVKYPGDNKIVLKIQSRLEEDKCTATLTANLKK